MSRPLGLVPHLFVCDVDAALSFYTKAFGAIELFRTVLPDGTVLFVELAVGDARLLVSQEIAALDALAPSTIGGTPLLLTLETADPDDLVRRAVFSGASSTPRRTSTRANRTRSNGGRAPSGRWLHPPARASPRLRRRPA